VIFTAVKIIGDCVVAIGVESILAFVPLSLNARPLIIAIPSLRRSQIRALRRVAVIHIDVVSAILKYWN